MTGEPRPAASRRSVLDEMAQERWPDDDDEMTRTELAMLWDLLGRFKASHTDQVDGGWHHASSIRKRIDAELAERFGG